MTVLGAPETFRQDWIAGLAAAYSRLLYPVPGASGVLRNDVPRHDRVAVLIGGGCGHYPAFAGLVGPGLAHGAVIGDVFTSPSAEQVYRVAKAADGGAGVLFCFGNYAGDVMHFGLAGRRLDAEGIANNTVLVTDDVASGEGSERRGVAGGFFVFRVAAAAADQGASLAEVARVAEKANARTRTFGVAYGGCTLPGAEEPLFTVESGAMELGLGIHGEAGIKTVGRMSPTELADVLVDSLLKELPTTDGRRVAVLLNGLGRTKYEEMLVCYGHVDARLRNAGLELWRPEVGEFVTSLDMAGLSLSLMVLDDELQSLLETPCEAPGYRYMAAGPAVAPVPVLDAAAESLGPIDEPVNLVAQVLAAALAETTAKAGVLGDLDAVAGDGDHGLGMVRGLTAAVRAANDAGRRSADASSVGAALLAAGTAHADAAGGASGACATDTGMPKSCRNPQKPLGHT
jgi:dihydroxyacetone kinase